MPPIQTKKITLRENAKEKVEIEFPNLDAYQDTEDLRQVILDCETIRNHLNNFERYAEYKRDAIIWRKIGEIDKAMSLEQACEEIWRKLPDEMKW